MAAAARLRRVRRLVILLVVGLVAFLATSWWASGVLLTPARHAPHTLAPLAPETVTLDTADGLTLAGWVLEPEGTARGTVVLLHGKDGCRSSERLGFLHARGFRSVALDHRGHGESEGRFTGFGWHERLDVEAAVSFVRERWPNDPLLAWGMSQGSAAIVYFGDHHVAGGREGLPFDGVILESLYADVDTAFENRVDWNLGRWALPCLFLARRLAIWRGEIDAELLRPVDAIRALQGVPVLLANGDQDPLCRLDEQEQLGAAAPWAETVVVPGKRHVNLLPGRQDTYGVRVAHFLEAAVASHGR